MIEEVLELTRSIKPEGSKVASEEEGPKQSSPNIHVISISGFILLSLMVF